MKDLNHEGTTDTPPVLSRRGSGREWDEVLRKRGSEGVRSRLVVTDETKEEDGEGLVRVVVSEG